MTTFRETIKWVTQYQRRQWEATPYEGREFSAALYEKDDTIARITLNRPEKRNALNDAMFSDLMAGLHNANDDTEVRVVIIRGAGPNFSAGHDLSSPVGDESPPIHPSLSPNVRDFYNIERRRCNKHEDLFNFPKPTIAQVHGYCIGAGAEIQAACDITIAAEDAQFGIRGFGVAPTGLYGHNVGPWPGASHKQWAGKILPELSGKEMEMVGAINKAVPLEKLEEETNKWAQVIANQPRDALAVTKEFINGMLDITGYGAMWRTHYEGHVMIQWVRFRGDEVSFYKSKKDRGLKGFLQERAMHATPKKKHNSE